jgi:phosphonate C-P lyase system protein PhnH
MSALSRKHEFDLVFDSQNVYRALLSAFSYPGRTENIALQAEKLYGGYPELTALAVTLLDNEVCCHICGGGDLREEIRALTGSPVVPIEDADFVFIADPSYIGYAIKKVKGGTLTDPHKSATVIIYDDKKGQTILNLRGPGIKGIKSLTLSDAVVSALGMRDSMDFVYPQGVDLVFISADGDLFAVPRLVGEAV